MAKISLSQLPYLIISSLVGIASFAASITYLVFALTLGPKQIRNQYISFWLAVLLFFFSAQAIYIVLKRRRNIINRYFYLDSTYYILTACGGLVLLVFFSLIPWRVEAIVFSTLILTICMSNFTSLLSRRTSYYSQVRVLNQEKLELKVHPDKEPPDLFEHLREDETESVCFTILRIINIIFKVIFLVILALMAMGAGVTATGYLWYPARGNFSIAKLNDTSGRELRIHFLCDGPKDDNRPIFIFDGSGSHVMADYFGIQLVMTENGRRSCIFDLPGQGYTDNLYNDMLDFQIIYPNMISSLGEKPPFIMVGWAGGGETIYKYARDHPEMVDSLVFLDVYPIDIEFKTPYVLKNWTEAERDEYKHDTIASRRSLLDLINSLVVPFGLTQLFIPLPDRYPPDRRAEMRWFFLTDRTWVAQRHWIRTMFDNEDTFEKYTIDQNIPIHVFSTYFTDEQVVNKTCIREKKINPESEECKYEVAANRYQTSEKEDLVHLTQGGGQIVRCTMDECGLGYWIDVPQFTVEKLIEIYGGKS